MDRLTITIGCPPPTLRGPCLAASGQAVATDVSTWPQWASVKLDGIRCLILPGDVPRRPRSRTLATLPNRGLVDLLADLHDLADRTGRVFDGELYSHRVAFDDLRAAIMSEDAPLPDGLAFFTIDCLPLAEWNGFFQGETPRETPREIPREIPRETPFRDRYRATGLLVSDLSSAVRMIEQRPVATWAQAQTFYQGALAGGYEGAILRDPAGLYVHGRVSGDLHKLKEIHTWDAQVLAIVQNAKNITARVRLEDGRELSVGGFSRATAEALVVGGWIEIAGTTYGARKLPRFPRFARHRAAVTGSKI